MLPTLSTCNLINRNDEQSNLIVHCVEDLRREQKLSANKPHRHTFYQILHISDGSGEHKIDFKSHTVTNHSLFFLAPGQVHNLILTPNCQGMLINFSESLFHTFLANTQTLENYPFFWSDGKFSHYNVAQEIDIINTLERIKTHRNNKELVRIYLLELFHFMNLHHQKTITENAANSTHRLISLFDNLIEKNYHLEHYPKFYAEQLAVTPNHLNAICQKYRNKKAGETIRERITLEAKRLLINSQLSISEIGYMLGFDDNSYFTKFFKQSENITPKQFRKQSLEKSTANQ